MRLKQIYYFISIQIAPILISISDCKAISGSHIRAYDQVYIRSKQLDCTGRSGGNGHYYPGGGAPPLHHSSRSNHGVAGGQPVVDYYHGPSANIWPGTVLSEDAVPRPQLFMHRQCQLVDHEKNVKSDNQNCIGLSDLRRSYYQESHAYWCLRLSLRPEHRRCLEHGGAEKLRGKAARCGSRPRSAILLFRYRTGADPEGYYRAQARSDSRSSLLAASARAHISPGDNQGRAEPLHAGDGQYPGTVLLGAHGPAGYGHREGQRPDSNGSGQSRTLAAAGTREHTGQQRRTGNRRRRGRDHIRTGSGGRGFACLPGREAAYHRRIHGAPDGCLPHQRLLHLRAGAQDVRGLQPS